MSEGGGDIIIKKIKKGGHAHHGGAWKIAYADFVTAMMAFFLLLWLLSSVSEETLKSLSDYFTPTIGLKDEMGIGFDGGIGDRKDGKKKEEMTQASIVMGAPTAGAIVTTPDSVNKKLEKVEEKNFTSMQSDLYKAINENPELKEFSENILITQTPEGLKIQLLDDEDRPMFIPGTAKLQPYTKKLLAIIAKQVRYLPNYLSIDGHTNTVAGSSESNWRLSALRANSARSFLSNGHIDHEQVARIIGKGDQEPIDKERPESPRNMRLSMTILKNSIVPFQKRAAPKDIDLEK